MSLAYSVYAKVGVKQTLIAKTRGSLDAVRMVYDGDLNRVIKFHGRIVWTVKDANGSMWDANRIVSNRVLAILDKKRSQFAQEESLINDAAYSAWAQKQWSSAQEG